jgi:hypothetical protein
MTYPITGIQKGLGPRGDPLRTVPLRREVDEWWESSNPVDVNSKDSFPLGIGLLPKDEPGGHVVLFPGCWYVTAAHLLLSVSVGDLTQHKYRHSWSSIKAVG